nr:hypothetical protein Iba_chr11cCG4180 [Ipomoea batatas]
MQKNPPPALHLPRRRAKPMLSCFWDLGSKEWVLFSRIYRLFGLLCIEPSRAMGLACFGMGVEGRDSSFCVQARTVLEGSSREILATKLWLLRFPLTQVLGFGRAGGLVGELGGRGNRWHSLFASSNFPVGESKLPPTNRGCRGDGVVVGALDLTGLRDSGLILLSPTPLPQNTSFLTTKVYLQLNPETSKFMEISRYSSKQDKN